MNDQKIEKLLNLLRKRSDSMAVVKKTFEESGNERMARYYAGQIMEAEVVIMLLTDDDFFDKLINICLK